MDYKVETYNNGISLIGYKNHITLYESDLMKCINFDTNEDNFVKKVNDWIWDIICEEYGYENVQYDSMEFSKILKTLFPILKTKFKKEHSQDEKAAYLLKKKKDLLVSKLMDYKILNPIYNFFWNKYQIQYYDIPKFVSDSTIIKKAAYNEGTKAVKEYIEKNAIDLTAKTKEEREECYKTSFEKAYKETLENFDIKSFRKNCGW